MYNNAGLFTVAHFRAKTKTTNILVREFTYLGSIIASDGQIEAELQKRMSKASMSFGRLRERLWNNHNVSIRVKGKIYRAIILSILLYGAETWKVYRRHVKKLHAFMMRHLRSIMKIRWQDKVTNIKVLKWAGLSSMEDFLIRKNLRWIGHPLRIYFDIGVVWEIYGWFANTCIAFFCSFSTSVFWKPHIRRPYIRWEWISEL